MTEDEAKTKWCPFVQVAVATGSAVMGPYSKRASNRPTARYPEDDNGPLCLGSACMAWRRELASPGEPTTDGFCGLAGAPQ